MAELGLPSKVVVLVVEDEPTIRAVTAIHLEDAGFAAIEAENADEAIRILESTSGIAIVFTDIDMPGSMDGVKLAAAIHGRWPPIKVVLTTGGVKVTHADLPPDSVFIPKPYGCQTVVEALHKLVS